MVLNTWFDAELDPLQYSSSHLLRAGHRFRVRGTILKKIDFSKTLKAHKKFSVGVTAPKSGFCFLDYFCANLEKNRMSKFGRIRVANTCRKSLEN